MIDVKEATKIAADYLKSFIPDAKRIQLEEVELDDENTYWLITLSFADPEIPPINMYGIPKIYKIFKIASDTGDVQSMKIRVIK